MIGLTLRYFRKEDRRCGTNQVILLGFLVGDEEGIALSYILFLLNEVECYIPKNYILCSSKTVSKCRDVLPFLKPLRTISNSSNSNHMFNS